MLPKIIKPCVLLHTFYANDSRQSHPLRIKRSGDSRPFYFAGEDENPADAKHLCGFERGVSRVLLRKE